MESINSIHFYCVLTMGAKLKKDRVAKKVPPEDESMGNFIFPRIFYHVFIVATGNMCTTTHQEEDPIETKELV